MDPNNDEFDDSENDNSNNVKSLASGSSNSNLAFGDALYLHPNDTSESPLIHTKLTGTENYKMWSIAMKLALSNKNKLGFIDNTCKRPAATDPLAIQWDMCNFVVLTWILNSISPELYAGQIYSKSPSVVWDDLKETYDKFLMGLDEVYLPIRSNLLSRDPLPSIKFAFAVISREESHKNASSGNTAPKPHASAFVAKGSDFKKNNNFRGPNPNLTCTNCGKIGHTVERCYDIIGYPPGYNKPKNQSSSGGQNKRVESSNNVVAFEKPKYGAPLSFTNEQMLRLMNLINEKPAPSFHANMADSGANQHMTISEKFLHNIVDISNLGLIVGHPNGTQALIHKIRDLKLANNIMLYDVLVVPEYTVNLLSVHKLDRDSKLFIGFDEHKCYIQDLKKKEIMRTGNEQGGLYLFNIDDNSLSKNSESPDDDGRVSSYDDGYESCHIQESDSDSPETSIDENTHPEGNIESHYDSDDLNKSVEPRTYHEAILDENWVNAMNEEMEALNRNQTWTLTDLPAGRKPIGCKWVYKIKYKSNGEIERYKARLVAKGYSQREGIDYEETFSPIVKMVIVRCLIALAVKNGWNLYQLDVNNAFLYGSIEEDVYTTLPPGYFSKSETKVCKLVKSLYGLKQAPRKWNEKLMTVLSEIEFIQIQSEHYLFIKSKGNLFVAFSKFQIKDLGKLKYFLGIEVLDENNCIFLSQRKYCLELLQEFGMLGCKPVSIPMEANHCMHAPLKSNLKDALNVLRYLKGSPGKGIKYTSDLTTSDSSGKILGYTDADWAKWLITKKSVSTYCLFFNNCLIFWKSKKQATLSKSSTEYEYRAMGSTTCEIMWIIKILKDLKINVTLPVPLFCDNKSAIQIANNPVFLERTKHFEVDVHFIREKIAKGIVKTYKIESSNQTADIFTKHLPVSQHQKLSKQLVNKEVEGLKVVLLFSKDSWLP
ncbi:putative RNA-directed DNA polymerase [Tanacetum coccineum]